jgi:hypothetical protein
MWILKKIFLGKKNTIKEKEYKNNNYGEDNITKSIIDYLINSIKDLIKNNSIIINWKKWNYVFNDSEIEEDAILVKKIITDMLDENENKKDLKIDEILELCEKFYKIIWNLLEKNWPNKEKREFILYTLSFILKMSQDKFNKKDILYNYDWEFRNESLLKAKEFLVFSLSLSDFTKNVLIKILEYSNYFENFPIFIEETKKILTKMNEDLEKKWRIETFPWINFYETSINALDENWKFLWILDKENSNRLLKILFIRVLLFQYIKTLDKDNIQVPFLDILVDALKKELAWFNDTMENFWENILFLLTWKNIKADIKEKYEESKLHNLLIWYIEQEKRKKVLSICLIKPNWFFEKWEIPFQRLFNFITAQDDEKLDEIEKFLEKYKKINFLENNLLFIFENNLEDFNFKKDDLDEDIEFIGDLIKDYKKTPHYICSLDRESFELLRDTYKMVGYIVYSNNKDALNEDLSIGNNDLRIGANLLIFILKDNENGIEKYKKYKKMKEKMKEDKKYIHPSYPYYKKIQELEGKNINENFSFDNFSQEFEELYGDEEFQNMLTFNKKVLGENKNLETLDSFYILFWEVETEDKKALIEEIFLNSQENIQFLYEIFISSKWIDNSIFQYVSLAWNIYKIIQNKNLFENVKNHQEMLDGINLCIDDGENPQEKDGKNLQISNYFIELYWEWWKNFLKEKNIPSQEIDQLNRIWEIIKESYKQILLKNIQENKLINFKWLYSLLSFFYNFWITNFDKFEKIIVFTNQDKVEENIKYLFQVFSKYNIINGEREKFKW